MSVSSASGTCAAGECPDARRGAGATPARFLLGDWLVDVTTRRLQRGALAVAIEPLPMAVLAQLCLRPGEVLGADALVEACWPGEPMGDNPVHKVIAGLRRALQDSAAAPRYIETIRKQGYRMVAPIRVLSGQGPRSHHGGWRGSSPFRGLEPFDCEHASVFCGRDEAIAELHARLDRQWQRGSPFVLLLGPSGSGKTSLVQAGLLPALSMPATFDASTHARAGVALRACTTATAFLAVQSDPDPWSDLAGALLDWECAGRPVLSGYSIDTLAEALRDRCDEVLRFVRIGLEARSASQGEEAQQAPPVLVIDRLEALFLPEATIDARAFMACVDRLVRSRLMVVLAVCRNDFYPCLAAHPILMRDKEHGAHFDLPPPDAGAIAQMIRLPARAADLVYGTDPDGMNRLDDCLCADAMHVPDALPLLQYALHELYLGRGAGNELTWEAYETMGRLEGVIGHRAETVLAGLPSAQQHALAGLLSRLTGMTGDATVPHGRWVPEDALEDEDERGLVRAFIDARLLVADRVGGVSGFRVAHEALLRRWPRVTVWIAQHRAILAARDDLAPWVRRWLGAGRDDALLLPKGATLWQARRAIAEAPRLFSEDERECVRRSQVRIRRRARWRLIALAGMFALAVLAGLAAVAYARVARVAGERELQSQRLASFMLGDLANRLRPLGKLDLLRSIGEQGLSLFGQGASSGETPQDVLQRARALVVIGEVNSSRGQAHIDVAVAALREADRLLASVSPGPGVDAADVYRTRGASAFWQGQIAFDADDLATAASQMERYRQACEQWLRAAPADPRARIEIGFALNSLGSIAFRRGAWPEAGRWFATSLHVKLASLAEHPMDAELLDAAANSRLWLGMAAHVEGQPAKALELYDATRSAQAGLLARHPEEGARLHDLGVTDVHRAESLQALGRMSEALDAMEGAIANLGRAASVDATNMRWRGEVLHARSGLLLMRIDAGLQASASLAELDQALARDGEAGASPDLQRATEARLSVARAALAAREGSWRQALTLAAVADRNVLDLVARGPANWQGRELQARLGQLNMQAWAALGNAARRTDVCSRTRAGLQPAIDSGQGGRVLEAWLIARACSGDGPAVDAGLRHLVAGGYVPTDASLASRLPIQKGSP